MADLFAGVLELPASAPVAAEAVLASEVWPRFGAQPEPLQTDPRAYLHEVDDQRGAQTIQLLRNLGYLPPPAASDQPAIIRAEAIETAWNRWAADFRANARKAENDPGKVAIRVEATPALPENDRLRRALKACGTLEGEVELREWPETDEGLAVRVLSYRVKLFGLQEDSPGLIDPASAGLRQHLVRRAGWVVAEQGASGDALAVVNALGNVEVLGKTAAARLKGWAVILRSYTAEERAASPLLPGRVAPLADRPRPGRALPSMPAPDSPGRVKILNLTDPVDDAWNELAVKIVQVRLWTLGYYPGAIDGSWGELSEAALNRFIDDDDDDAARPDLRRLTPEGHLTLTVTPLLETMAGHADELPRDLDRSQIDGALDRLREAADRHEQRVDGQARPAGNDRDESTDAAAAEAWTSLTKPPERKPEEVNADDEQLLLAVPKIGFYVGDDYVEPGRPNPKRSVYQGWRGIFAGFGRVLRRFLTKVGDFFKNVAKGLGKFARALVKAAKAGLGYVRQIVAYIKNATRVAVRVTSLAVARLRAWLGHTPIVTHAGTMVVGTDWQFDFDTTVFVSRGCPDALLADHQQSLDWMARSFAIVTRLGLALLKLILALGNWLLFAWRALALIREVIAVSGDSLFRELMAKEAVV